MLLGSTAISSTPLASDLETPLLGGSQTGTGLDVNVLRNRSVSVFYVELAAKNNDFEVPDISDANGIAGQPIAASTPESLSLLNAPTLTFRFSDVLYYPRSDDILRPNRVPFASLINAGDLERTISFAIEDTNRGQTSFGKVEIANADGRFDAVFDAYNPDKNIITGWVGNKYSAFTTFFKIYSAQCGQWYKSRERITIPVSSSVSDLNTVFSVGIYDGSGNYGGDEALKGVQRPFLYGRGAYNITPRLIDKSRFIYQVSGTEVSAITAVRDMGLELLPSDGDFATYNELRDMPITTGGYATCNRLGIFRVNFEGGSPGGLVTCDADGLVVDGENPSTISGFVEYIITKVAGYGSSLVDISSIRELPLGQIAYYYDGTSQLTISNIIDEVIKTINGYYIINRQNKYIFDYHTDPDETNPVFTLKSGFATDNDIISIEQEENDIDTLFNVQYNYNRNWTVMSSDDISSAVSDIVKTRLTSQFDSVSASNFKLQFTDPSAKGIFIDTYFTERDSALLNAQKQLNLRKTRRMKHIVKTKLIGLSINPGDIIRIVHPRFAPNGKNYLVYRTLDRLSQGIVELGVYG